MIIMSLIWITLSIFTLMFLIKSFSKRNTKLPPGPKGYPIIGCLHLLGKHPHKNLHILSQKHGPIMFLNLGSIPTLVVSSPQAAEQILKTHDLVFAGRPSVESLKYMAYNQKNPSFSPYGFYWRTMRKICTLELLSSHKIASFKSVRTEELALLVEDVKVSALKGDCVDLSSKVATFSADLTCRMVFGKKYEDNEFDERGFKAVFQEAMALIAMPNLSDYIPSIAGFDVQRIVKRSKGIGKVFDGFLEKIIDEHVRLTDENGDNKDFVDVLLGFVGSKETEYCIEREHIKAIILDILGASIDTSAATIEWVISELLKNPTVMKKVQIELEDVVGKDRMVEESDLDKLEYMDMVIKETLRLHPVAPLLLPHESMEDCVINNFHIPKKSRVFINVWSIGRDPNVWNDPEKFYPERFVGSGIDLHGHDFRLIPFGSGRRSCPGIQLGLIVVRLVLAQLMHCFDWELPGGMLPSELDMTEHFGLVTSRAKHLLSIPTSRLNLE